MDTVTKIPKYPPTLQQALRDYDQQLLAARRLARFRVQKRLAAGLPPQDMDPSIKRNETVRNVARELYQSLIFTGSPNPVVENILADLSLAMGRELEFTYPPGEDLCIVAKTATGLEPLSAEDQKKARALLERIVKTQVDISTERKPLRRSCCEV